MPLARIRRSGLKSEETCCEQLAGPAEAGYNLIEHEEDIVLSAEFLSSSEIAWRGRTTPPVPMIGSQKKAAMVGPREANSARAPERR